MFVLLVGTRVGPFLSFVYRLESPFVTRLNANESGYGKQELGERVKTDNLPKKQTTKFLQSFYYFYFYFYQLVIFGDRDQGSKQIQNHLKITITARRIGMRKSISNSRVINGISCTR